MKKLLFIISAISISLFSCTKDEVDITPSENPGGNVPNIGMALNQGTNMYNDIIQKFYDDYGCVLVYEFPENSLNYIGGSYFEIDIINYTYAEESYVGYILDFYSKIAASWGGAMGKTLTPRNIYIVETAKIKGVTKLIHYNNVRMVIAGASEAKQVEFYADIPYTEENMDELYKINYNTEAKRTRIKFRYDLLWNMFNEAIDNGKVSVPEWFVEHINQTIDVDKFNSFTKLYNGNTIADVAAQNNYLRELGFLTLKSGTTGLSYDAMVKIYPNHIDKFGTTSVMILDGGQPTDEDQLKVLVKNEFVKHFEFLFKHGYEYVKNGVGNSSQFQYYKYPKLTDILEKLIDHVKEIIDTDLRITLSEDALRVPADDKVE